MGYLTRKENSRARRRARSAFGSRYKKTRKALLAGGYNPILAMGGDPGVPYYTGPGNPIASELGAAFQGIGALSGAVGQGTTSARTLSLLAAEKENAWEQVDQTRANKNLMRARIMTEVQDQSRLFADAELKHQQRMESIARRKLLENDLPKSTALADWYNTAEGRESLKFTETGGAGLKGTIGGTIGFGTRRWNEFMDWVQKNLNSAPSGQRGHQQQ